VTATVPTVKENDRLATLPLWDLVAILLLTGHKTRSPVSLSPFVLHPTNFSTTLQTETPRSPRMRAATSSFPGRWQLLWRMLPVSMFFSSSNEGLPTDHPLQGPLDLRFPAWAYATYPKLSGFLRPSAYAGSKYIPSSVDDNPGL
jgi:hypothetical protein